jgi:hypothetical protein
MKTIRTLSHRSPSILAFASACLFAAAVPACSLFGGEGSKQPLKASAENKSGVGTVQSNTDLEVEVKHLAPAANVEADASVYVVWLKPRHEAIQNLGALEVDKDLVGTFNTTTPHRSFTLSVTPEPSSRMSEPSHRPVFTSDVVADR